MYRILTHTALTATLATFAFAQAPQTPDQQPAPRQTETSSAAPASGGQSYKGVLMDASCQAIQSRSTATTASDVTRSRPMPRSTASAAEAGNASTSATTTATTGVATDQSGQATATNRTTTIGRETDKSSSSVKTYDGTTATGERSRSAHTNPDVQWTTVREKYKDCKVSSTTTSFAIMSNGQLYMLDGGSDALKQRTSTNTPSDWHTVTVVGNVTGDRITVTSVR